MNAQLEMPPFPVVAAALRKTTEQLAAEVVRSSAAAPRWSELEWAIAQSAAAMQGITALLAQELAWSGPPAWRGFLAEQHEQSVLRDARIGALLERLDAVLRKRRVASVALKGAALRALSMYRMGARPMGDIDLLVSAGDLQAIAAAMVDVDYVEAYTKERHRVYEPRQKTATRGFGEHVDNALKIEIHVTVGESLPVRKVEITDRLWPANVEPGLNAYPDTSALLLHLLLHAAGNMRAHALRQIQLHDIAELGSRLSVTDWRKLLEQPRDKRAPWWVFPPLALTARYYPERIPADVLRAARAACPRILRLATERRSLTDVSWSNVRIHAFPGIEWSRTPLDALRFARSRVVPSRQALTEMKFALVGQPQLERVPWYGITHGRRILRWLFSQPPRAQTMLSVQAALEGAGLGATEPSRAAVLERGCRDEPRGTPARAPARRRTTSADTSS